MRKIGARPPGGEDEEGKRGAGEAMRINLAASGVKFVLFRRQVTTLNSYLSLFPFARMCKRELSFPNYSPMATLIKCVFGKHTKNICLGTQIH